ncbi:diguanylate cyclase (GGDEF) domain-containing protein [Klenkia marina]|uniref:Diguanylate cyclase (GGDEF) domain-containing protein n=1 Tax=Klenkia marina TaxID=1960309 RepID=A0A1G4YV07_9ACTN|nr:diguanylate cyclase [Klenkia marina]SCX57309.1 diguanylate cyclase (GGDEF) domain-containing protein [Klenkia marina]
MGALWVLAYGLAALLTTVVGSAAWSRRRDNPGARALALTLAGSTGWSLANAWITAPVPEAQRALGYPLVFVSVGATVVGFWALSQLIADPRWRLRRGVALLLAAEPVALAVLAVLPATADLVLGRTDLTAATGEVQLVGGPLFAVHTVYSYLLIATSLLRLVRAARTGPPVVRRQAVVMLASALPPVLGNVVMTAGMRGDGVVDLTPIFFAVTGLVAGWAVLRAGLLDVVPVARDQVVETMTDAVLVSDRLGRLVDLNPAARRLLQQLRPAAGPDVLGADFSALVGPELLAAVLPTGPAADGTYAAGHAVVQAGADLWLDVQTVPVGRGRRAGRLTVVRDVSTEQRREADLRRLNEELAQHVATVDRLRATLAEEAVRDPLTGLHNRRHLDRVLGRALADAERSGEPVALVAVDVDHFKSVNDRFGHAAGDDVLRAVADELRAAARSGDTIARVGGEEFVLVLVGADEDAALARADELRARCADRAHPVAPDPLTLTVSAGVAVVRSAAVGADGALARADQALYAAKAAGRDRVELAAPDAVPPAARQVGAADVHDVLSPS